MPERKNTFRAPTVEVQGADSWVELRRMSWERQQVAQVLLAEAAGGVLPREQAAVRLTAEFLRQNATFTRELLAECVVGWNWVDDAGEPLALPGAGGQLTTDEVMLLVRLIQGSGRSDISKN